MASIFSFNVSKGNLIGCLTRLCKSHNLTQVAFMKRMILREEVVKPPPYPYWKKSCQSVKLIFDPLLFRYDENTKLIVVDGLPAIGKSNLCQKLAEEFGLLYMPAPTYDDMYINPYGFDIRELDPQMPSECKSFDLKNYLADPNNRQVAAFQYGYFMMRLEQYMNALLHMMATGQGVILNRSIYDDIAFTEVMCAAGYISNNAKHELLRLRKIALSFLIRPHVIICLEVTPEVCLERINQRGNPYEINSKVLTKNYLSDLDTAIKEKCLAPLSTHTHVLMYDWSKVGNHKDIVHDIECLDLESDLNKGKLIDWVFNDKDEIMSLMDLFQDKTLIFHELASFTPGVPVEELYIPPHQVEEQEEILSTVVSEKYQYGINPELGDKIFMTKTQPSLSVIRRTPRDFVNCKFFKNEDTY